MKAQRKEALAQQRRRSVAQAPQGELELDAPSTSTPPPPVLDAGSLPHLIDAIFNAADRSTLLTLRTVCSAWCDRANSRLVSHLVFGTDMTYRHALCADCGYGKCPYPPIPVGFRFFGAALVKGQSHSLSTDEPKRLPLWINVHHEGDDDLLLFGSRPVKKGAVKTIDYPANDEYRLPWWVNELAPQTIRARTISGCWCRFLEHTRWLCCDVFVARPPIRRNRDFPEVHAQRVVIAWAPFIHDNFFDFLWINHFITAKSIVILFHGEWNDQNVERRQALALTIGEAVASDGTEVLGPFPPLIMVNFDPDPSPSVSPPQLEDEPGIPSMQETLSWALDLFERNSHQISADNIQFWTLDKYREEVGEEQYQLEVSV